MSALSDRFIGIGEVCEAMGKSKATVYRWVKQGIFPAPLKINHSTLWSVGDINEWIAVQQKKGAVAGGES